MAGGGARGSVSVTIDGVTVSITTTAGQSAATVAAALVTAINADTALQALNDISAAQGSHVVTTGNLESLVIDDDGLDPPLVPALGLAGRAALALSLAASLVAIARKRAAARRRITNLRTACRAKSSREEPTS